MKQYKVKKDSITELQKVHVCQTYVCVVITDCL